MLFRLCLIGRSAGPPLTGVLFHEENPKRDQSHPTWTSDCPSDIVYGANAAPASVTNLGSVELTDPVSRGIADIFTVNLTRPVSSGVSDPISVYLPEFVPRSVSEVISVQLVIRHSEHLLVRDTCRGQALAFERTSKLPHRLIV